MASPTETPETMHEDTKAQLLRLKDLTKRTGLLQEAQVINLKHWPFVLWAITDHEIRVDCDDCSINFVLHLKSKKTPAKREKAAARKLEAWVQSILGDEWLVTVQYRHGKGKERDLYQGERKAEHKPIPPPGADFKRYKLKNPIAAAEAVIELPPIIQEK